MIELRKADKDVALGDVKSGKGANCEEAFSKLQKRIISLVTRNIKPIQELVTAVLRSIPKEAFADSFQKVYESCQPCVCKDDDYFEGQ
jgi:hypothetical protein